MRNIYARENQIIKFSWQLEKNHVSVSFQWSETDFKGIKEEIDIYSKN